MTEAVLVVSSVYIAVSKKEFLCIFVGLYHIIYMIILHGNIPHKQIRKQNNSTWWMQLQFRHNYNSVSASFYSI